MPCTRTRTGAVIPAGPVGGENEKNVPDGSMLTSPGAGAATVSVSATVPTRTSVAPGMKPAP